MGSFKDVVSRGKDWAIAGILAAVAAVVYLTSLAGYAFPGEGARLMALWNGLDAAAVNPHPLMAAVYRLFGGSNLLAPVCGIVSVLAIYHLTAFFTRERINGEATAQYATAASRVAAVSATLIFIFTPSVREAATHLSSAGFETAWALATFALFIPYARAGKSGWVFPPLVGVAVGFGLADSPVFAPLGLGYLAATWAVSKCRGGKPYLATFAVLLVALVTFFAYAPNAAGDFTESLRAGWNETKSWVTVDNWLLVALFAVLPFAVSLFSSYNAYNQQSGFSQWIFHLAMSFISVLAIATPASPSALLRPAGMLPVLPCAMAAATAGYLLAYWWLLSFAKVRINESVDLKPTALKGRSLALVALPVLALVFVVTVFLDFFSFDSDRGEFADKTARKILADLGDRTWFVTDGVLDDHLRLEAAKAGKELNLICLQRDLDERYLASLGKLVEEKGLGGEKNSDLSLSLALGVLPFVQDWFAADTNVASKVAIFGAPDLWYSADIKAVPEFLFFGANPDVRPDWDAWSEFDRILAAPKGWGSYRLWQEKDPLEMMRLRLRRHLGLIANDRGVFLQDRGDNDAAFTMYELVLSEIDRDNVCALFNEFEMARAGHPRAAAKKKELEKALKAIVDDKDRRYILWKLSNTYGYIRSPEIFIRLGFSWARSGRPGDALSQIRRAIDFVPTDRRSNILNMMAALYASDSDVQKSREVYESVLSQDGANHVALIGLMRLELMDGNSERAIEYLQRATKAAGDDPRAATELAMLHMMKNELGRARALLEEATDANPDNLQTWSLLAAVLIQQCDAAKDEAAKRKLTKELEERILPQMEKRATRVNDYHVQTTKAFVMLRQGTEKRRAARDALVAAAKARPDVMATQDLVLGLDISLNDTVDAERHARDVLRRNRKAPLANYVMGSLALQRGENQEAEMYLRRASDAAKPVVLAQNDLAEVLRRTKRFAEAETYARLAIKNDPNLYVAWETLGAILMDSNGDLDEAEKSIEKAVELSKGADGKESDIRMVMSLARVQATKGDVRKARNTLRNVKARVKELSEFERAEYEELQKRVR